MFRRKIRNNSTMPNIQISPMIDMVFLLLIFFIMTTMFLTQVKTIPLQLPAAQNAVTQTTADFIVAIKADGSTWLGDKKMPLDNILIQAKSHAQDNANFAVIVRADEKTSYGTVINLLDKLKQVGVTRIGMATMEK